MTSPVHRKRDPHKRIFWIMRLPTGILSFLVALVLPHLIYASNDPNMATKIIAKLLLFSGIFANIPLRGPDPAMAALEDVVLVFVWMFAGPSLEYPAFLADVEFRDPWKSLILLVIAAPGVAFQSALHALLNQVVLLAIAGCRPPIRYLLVLWQGECRQDGSSDSFCPTMTDLLALRRRIMENSLIFMCIAHICLSTYHCPAPSQWSYLVQFAILACKMITYAYIAMAGAYLSSPEQDQLLAFWSSSFVCFSLGLCMLENSKLWTVATVLCIFRSFICDCAAFSMALSLSGGVEHQDLMLPVPYRKLRRWLAMDSSQVSSQGAFSTHSSRSRSSTKLTQDDLTSLTSFNPFSEEDEEESFVTSIFTRMKNITLSSVAAATTSGPAHPSTSTHPATAAADTRRPSYTVSQHNSNLSSRTGASNDRLNPLAAVHAAQPAPPLVSLTPAQSEVPTYSVEFDRSPSRTGVFPSYDSQDGGIFGTSIPGFPIQDDARSIKTTTSLHRSNSVSKVIRRIRGEGLSRDYWMDDENCKECYDCESVFTTWRRKHHCRICGQIFCSRCASNIIKGYRFGHDGMIRVCNLCVEKLAKVDDDDDDDRRSVVSSVTSFPAHQLGLESYHPQSPFSASQLFSRTDEPFNLYSIAETKRRISGSDESGFGSRPITPPMRQDDDVWEPPTDNPAPFRRALSDDEDNVHDPFTTDESPNNKATFEFPGAIPINVDAPSSIQFPKGSPDHLDSPGPNRLRSRFNSYAGDFESATPFIRSRVQSRLDNFPGAEPGWRTRRESTAYAQELNLTSMLHLKIMLRQMLTTEQIPNIKAWEETLLKLALRIARECTFTALPHRQGQDMDVRRYVKIKKIPGGLPSDSEYVDGAVITKNVAHKQMSRIQKNPRVMLVTFPLEYYRQEGQYMHFAQVVRQEKEYLGNLATRIAALRPHIVLVEKSVSRLALEALAKYNIAVARTVKTSAIQNVARMTQSDVFSSMDKLALEPRLGHCGRFRIQTFDHPLIPGRRKTYMRFEGCSRDMGCTIILRGENLETLRRIKKVTRFLTFIVRNLKLETHLWKDSVITLPSFSTDALPSSPGRHHMFNLSISSMTSLMFPSSTSTPRLMTPTPGMRPQNIVLDVEQEEEDLPDEDAEQVKLSRRIDQALEPYNTTFISVSATLRFPPPQPIRRMKELDNELLEAKRQWEDEVIRREEKSHPASQISSVPTTASEAASTPMPTIDISSAPPPPDPDDLNAQIEALATLSIPPTPSDAPTPRLLSPRTMDETPSTGYFVGHPTMSPGPMSAYSGSSVVTSPMEETRELLKTVEDIELESKYKQVKWQHEEQRRIWEWYLRKNADDFVVEKYQCISTYEFVLPLTEHGLHRACFAPKLHYYTFYGENDFTLGQYIEKCVNETLVQFLDPKAVCTGKGCDQPLARHCTVYIHNETRLFVAVEQWDGQIIGRMNHLPAPDLITTWSACRVCGSATPFIPVSEEMQRYSFAKFLELHFYPADVKLVQGAGCQHNIYQHHIRYFATKGMTIRFQADPITLHEVVYPPFRIRVRPETQLELKNNDFERLHRRNLLWYTGLMDDLKLISIDAATGDEEQDTRLNTDINKLIARAEVEKEDISRLINKIYRESPPTDTFALNQVHSYRQDKIVAWQQDFDRLPKPKPNAKRMSTFGSVRSMWPRRYDLAGAFDSPHLPSSSVSEAEEGSSIGMRRVTGDSFASASSASEPESEPNVDESVVLQVPKAAADGAVVPSAEAEVKSDAESDSTIGAGRDDAAPEDLGSPVKATSSKPQPSRLPRRANTSGQLNVAELVKKYQDFLPAQGVQDLAKTAFPPRIVVSESEQEYITPIRLGPRSKSRHRALVRKQSTSDFEQGYAANIAPKYLTHSRRPLGQASGSRIPGPVQSEDSSRRPSPEKRPSNGKGKDVRFGRTSRPSSPPPMKGSATTPGAGRAAKPRISGRTRDKTPSRPPPGAGGSKSAFRKTSTVQGNKVSNIAKHFERLGRDAERNKSRYAIIRGKRARPVASARAKVEVLDSVKDAIRDESESSDSSSEADDEGDENEEKEVVRGPTEPETEIVPQTEPILGQDTQESPENERVIPDVTVKTAPPLDKFPNSTIPEPPTGSLAEAVAPQRLPPPGPLSLPPSPFLASFKDVNNPLTPPPTDMDLASGTERNSILKALSGLWQQPLTSRSPFETDDPMNDPEHIFRESSMVVRTDEPTSIIALALNSPQYRDMLSRSRAEKRTAVREAKLSEGEAFMPDDKSVAESTSTWGVVDVDADELPDPTEDMKIASSKLPWAISFESGGLTISCTVLYPEQFDALRRTYDCEKSMIESLARCIKWDASGGKSGSAFLKTRDDRFIAKELSRPELQTMETFAPAYFDYMSSAVSADRPTLLAKIFGCYKLTFKKTGKDKGTGKSKSTQMNLLVMENLFYNRRFTKLYDLKGSTRNRHVQSTGRENEVLLDENLVQTAHLSPFYLREHSKRILRGALYNDTKFLSDVNVMDYSFLVGVDSSNNELVVGIVDYIRTYTWDKKLESWVKESAFLGGSARGEPTIITPKQYRQRFLGAMERYFPLVPDRWMKQHDSPEVEISDLVLELWPDW
ncbi:1-phosphatidylinositol-3-phosphate 5-kinase [Mycena kentingensis (nom. inval.)]|nr:1-phosphatidylinositol-3-phosphate 5-kinase [Mycena kentingensis (nom. inval.)]